MLNKSILVFVLFVLVTACVQEHSFIGDQAAYKKLDLEDYDRNIQFPTYAPFEIKDMHLEKEYRGPIDISKMDEDKKEYEGGLEQFAKPADRDNNKFYAIRAQYLSSDGQEALEVSQWEESMFKLTSLNSYDEKDLIDFGDGLQGLYRFNGHVQMFYWRDGDSTFMIGITSNQYRKEGDQEEVYSKEEVIKIAESFRNF